MTTEYKPRLRAEKRRGRPLERGRMAYKNACAKFNKIVEKHFGKSAKRLAPSEANIVYQRYNGRCVYCGIPLNVKEASAINALNFQYYIVPPHGKNDLDNIITVCREHSEQFHRSRHFREDIADIDTIADIIEVLVESVVRAHELKEKKHSDYFPMKEKITRLKRILNFKFQDLAINMQYKTFSDWEPENYAFIQEGNNGAGDLIAIEALATLEQDHESVEKVKKKQIDQLKQTLATKQYRVLRDDYKK